MEVDGIGHVPSTKPQEIGTPMCKDRRRGMSQPKSNFLLPLLFVLFRPSTNEMMPSHIGEGDFYSV